MTMKDWLDILSAIVDEKPFKLNYRLLKGGKLNAVIDALGGSLAAHTYFLEASNSEPADFENL